MQARPTRHPTDRDLRSLSTADLLALIRADIKELERIRPTRSNQGQTEKPVPKKGRARRPTEEEVRLAEEEAWRLEQATTGAESEEELPVFHAVLCCEHHMGDFPAIARVRCPFCGEWHRAGAFPVAR